jgi:hypothetical protein
MYCLTDGELERGLEHGTVDRQELGALERDALVLEVVGFQKVRGLAPVRMQRTRMQ